MQTSLPVLTFQLASAPFLQEFLSGFSRLLVSQLNPEISEQRVQAAVNELLGSVGANTPKPVNVRLEFKHVCKCVSLQQQQKQKQQHVQPAASGQRWHSCWASCCRARYPAAACCAKQLPVPI
jgi:hypothetical protein